MSSSRRQHRIALSTLSAALIAVLAAGPLCAQQAGTEQDKNKKKDEVTELERVQVTGSNIKRVDAETASPVQIVTAGLP